MQGNPGYDIFAVLPNNNITQREQQLIGTCVSSQPQMPVQVKECDSSYRTIKVHRAQGLRLEHFLIQIGYQDQDRKKATFSSMINSFQDDVKNNLFEYCNKQFDQNPLAPCFTSIDKIRQFRNKVSHIFELKILDDLKEEDIFGKDYIIYKYYQDQLTTGRDKFTQILKQRYSEAQLPTLEEINNKLFNSTAIYDVVVGLYEKCMAFLSNHYLPQIEEEKSKTKQQIQEEIQKKFKNDICTQCTISQQVSCNEQSKHYEGIEKFENFIQLKKQIDNNEEVEVIQSFKKVNLYTIEKDILKYFQSANYERQHCHDFHIGGCKKKLCTKKSHIDFLKQQQQQSQNTVAQAQQKTVNQSNQPNQQQQDKSRLSQKFEECLKMKCHYHHIKNKLKYCPNFEKCHEKSMHQETNCPYHEQLKFCIYGKKCNFKHTLNEICTRQFDDNSCKCVKKNGSEEMEYECQSATLPSQQSGNPHEQQQDSQPEEFKLQTSRSLDSKKKSQQTYQHHKFYRNGSIHFDQATIKEIKKTLKGLVISVSDSKIKLETADQIVEPNRIICEWLLGRCEEENCNRIHFTNDTIEFFKSTLKVHHGKPTEETISQRKREAQAERDRRQAEGQQLSQKSNIYDSSAEMPESPAIFQCLGLQGAIPEENF